MHPAKTFGRMLQSIALTASVCLFQGVPAKVQIDSLLGKIDPQRLAATISGRAKQLSQKICKKSDKLLSQLQRQEERILQKSISGPDSASVRKQLNELKAKYAAMRERLSENPTATISAPYIPKLDSLTTSLRFMEANGVSGKIKTAIEQAEKLKNSFSQAEQLKAFIKERREQLKTQLEKLGIVKELRKINKQMYYYAAQVREYREMLNDPKKIEKKALELLSKTKLFRDFMRKNSLLASLFRIPDPDSPIDMASLAGLQTRAEVTALVQAQIASGGHNATQQFQQNINAAQSQLNQLKEKLMKAGNKVIDGEMPEFKPNGQKTKSFLQRLELGTNLQTRRAGSYFPTTTDLGLSLGYKLNDNSIIGVGGSYKLGLGRGWNAIRFTHEGLGLRSFVDIKLKGSFWLSGGYEQNYQASFRDFDQLRGLSAWQQSGLIGISKTVTVKSRFFRKTKLQLLWDFLSYSQPLQAAAIKLRFGYSF